MMERNKHVVYEVSLYVETLGEPFVLAACEEVRRQRLTARVIHKTWVDNYVKILEVLLDALASFCKAKTPPQKAAQLTEAQWLCFGHWLGRRMNCRPIAVRTLVKQAFCMNKLLTILAAADVLPVQVEMPRPLPRQKSKDGESKASQRVRAPKSATSPASSPFAFPVKAHGRCYDHHQFLHLGRHFVIRLVQCLATHYAQFSAGTAKNKHVTVVSLLNYLTVELEARNFVEFFTQLKSPDFASISSLRWEQVLYAWRDSILTRSNGPSATNTLLTANNRVLALGRIWEHLAAASLVPRVTVVGFKNSKSRSGTRSRPSLAQLSPETPAGLTAGKELFDRIRRFFDTGEQREVHEFIRSLCHELSPEAVRGMSLTSLVDKIQALNAQRLQDLRAAAEADFLKWHAHWLRGQALMAATHITAESLVELLDSPLRSVSERRRNSAELIVGEPDTVRLGNALNYVMATKAGLASGVGGRYHHLIRNFGDSRSFHAYLHPHPDATLALWVLLLVDTGANCEVVREMPYACIHATNDLRTKKLVFGNKERADGKVIVDELNIASGPGTTLSAIDAIERYQQMSHRYRSVADAESAGYLFLTHHKGGVHLLPEWTARSWFIAMTRRHAALARLNVRPSFIRPSVLLDVQHRHIEGAVAAQAVADHRSAFTTQRHYTGRVPTTLRRTQMMREFQDRFQAVIIVSVQGAAAKLGLSEAESQRIFSDAARTGLGVACLDPKAGVQPGTAPGQDCTRMEMCPGCKMRWVVGTVANIADLMLFNEYLTESQAAAHQQHPDAWERRWLPWLVFSDIALTKLSQGETASAFVQAMQAAEVRRTAYQPFPLF